MSVGGQFIIFGIVCLVLLALGKYLEHKGYKRRAQKPEWLEKEYQRGVGRTLSEPTIGCSMSKRRLDFDRATIKLQRARERNK